MAAPKTKLPRGPEPTGTRPPTKAEAAHLRGEARSRDRAYQAAYERGLADAAAGRHQPPFPGGDTAEADAYQAGHDEAKAQNRRTSTPDGSRTNRRPAGGNGSRRQRTTGGRAGAAARRSTRTAARRTLAPVRASANGALTVIGGGVLLAVAYQALESADAAAGLLGGLNKALIWLREPVPIPYRHPR